MNKSTPKIPWSQRKKAIEQQYPNTVYLDWYQVFKDDPAIAGSIINDIIKINTSKSGKPGKRSAISEKDAVSFYRNLENDDYTIEPFKEALTILKGKDTIREVAQKTALDKSLVDRLLKGKAEPKLEYMDSIAEAYNKHPSYFVEYRILYIFGMLMQKFTETPEASIVPYKKLQGKHEKISTK